MIHITDHITIDLGFSAHDGRYFPTCEVHGLTDALGPELSPTRFEAIRQICLTMRLANAIRRDYLASNALDARSDNK